MKIHPEVQKDIYEEFARLNTKFPHLTADIKMRLAKEWIRELNQIRTSTFLKVYVGAA